MTTIPKHSGALLALLADLLRIENDLEEADRKALLRWRNSGRPPRQREKRKRIVLGVVDAALVNYRRGEVFGIDHRLCCAALTEGIVEALEAYDREGRRFDWLKSVQATIAFVLARQKVRTFRLTQNGVCAIAPRWLFAGPRGTAPTGGPRIAKTATAHFLGRQGFLPQPEIRAKRGRGTVAGLIDHEAIKRERKRRDAERKSLKSMREGRTNYSKVINKLSKSRGRPALRFELALEEVFVRFSDFRVAAIMLLSEIDAMADRLNRRKIVVHDNKIILAVLGGVLFRDYTSSD